MKKINEADWKAEKDNYKEWLSSHHPPLKEKIKNLCLLYPNDADLGREIRKLKL